MSRHEAALHQWLRIADAITNRGMPAPASVEVYDSRIVAVTLNAAVDATAWANHLGLEANPFGSAWAADYHGQIAGFSWSVRCMSDRSARARVARPQAGEVTA